MRRALLGALALATSLAATSARAQPAKAFDLDTLMALLAQRKSGQARFTEERTVTGFDSPLRASGTLGFTAPDRFVRQTLEPVRERMEVAGSQIRLERGGRVRRLTLDAVPELAALVEGLRGTLGGDAALLKRHFQVRVGGHAGLWTLTLVPADSTLATQVRQLQIVGTGADLRTVELNLGNGERSLMVIESVIESASGMPGRPAAGAASTAASAAAAGAAGRAPRAPPR